MTNETENATTYPVHDTGYNSGGYAITYIWDGQPYCGDCIADAMWSSQEIELTQGLTYHNAEAGESPITSACCNYILSAE